MTADPDPYCTAACVSFCLVAAGECEVRRPNGEPGESSGHIETHRQGEWSPHATGEAYCGQAGKNWRELESWDMRMCFYMYAWLYVCMCAGHV